MKTTTATADKVTTFTTPHEQKKTTPKATKKADKKQPKAKTTKPAGRDAFGGRLGTRMSAINLVVINAGKKGAVVSEVATKTKESNAVVSAQLGWMVSHKKVATRKEETNGDGKQVYRYTAKIS